MRVTTPTGKNAPATLRLSPKDWKDALLAYREHLAAKRKAEKDARELDKLIKPIKERLLAALGGVSLAKCDTLTVTVEKKDDVPATVTFADGSVIKWSAVTSVMVGNTHYPTAGAKLYGGRSGSTDINIAGE